MFRKQTSLRTLLIAALTISLANATLSVYNWQTLEEADESFANIKYSIANYGFAPFGKTIIGNLVHAPNFGEECIPEADPKIDYQNSFLLVSRGDCEFVTKTLNAQKLGAQMAIIMDDKKHEGSIVMADNGYGYKVNIPSIFIDYESGDKLKKLLMENEGIEDEETQVLMKITFDNTKTEEVGVTFYLQANNRHSYRFVENFRWFYPKIKDNIDFDLVYYTKSCKDCPASDCYMQGAYCAFNYKNVESANGKLILDQQIREQLLFEINPDQWWHYMKYVGDECAKISELAQCQKKALVDIGVNPEQFEERFKETFSGNGQNRFLKADNEHLLMAGVNKFPTVTLNSVKVRGNLHAEFVFDDICNTLSDPPSSCKKYIDTVIHESFVSIEWPTLVLVVALGIFIFSLIFCLYRRFMKKKISGEMQGRVDDMVSKYIEFYSERNK